MAFKTASKKSQMSTLCCYALLFAKTKQKYEKKKKVENFLSLLLFDLVKVSLQMHFQMCKREQSHRLYYSTIFWHIFLRKKLYCRSQPCSSTAIEIRSQVSLFLGLCHTHDGKYHFMAANIAVKIHILTLDI